MARAKRATVTLSGKIIRINCEGYEFRAEDIGWLNIHRGVLKRLARSVVLRFPNNEVARTAFDEMVTLGAGNVDDVPGIQFLDDSIRSLADRV